MTCDDARNALTHRESGALEPSVVARLDRHLAGCEACTRAAEIEAGFERTLRLRLPRPTAPAGLELRLRAALRAEAAPPAVAGRFERSWASLLAAAAVLAVALSPALTGAYGVAPGSAFDRVLTVVDRQCDGMGVPPALQPRCRHRGHVNALKAGPDGGYVTIGLDGAVGRRVLADPALRGTRVRVQGRLASDGGSVAIERIAAPGADVSTNAVGARSPLG